MQAVDAAELRRGATGQHLRRGAVQLAVARIWAAAVSVALVPLASRSLAPRELAVWLLVSVVATIAGLADLGIGAGLVARIACRVASGDPKGAATTAVTGIALLGALGLALAVSGVILLGRLPVDRLLGVDPGPSSTTAPMILLVACVSVGLPLSAGARLLQAAGDHEGLAGAVAAANTAQLCAGLMAWRIDLGLSAFVAISALLVPLTGVLCLLRAHRSGVFERLLRSVPSRLEARALLGSGSAFFLIAVAGALGFEIDGLIVSHTLDDRTTASFLVAARLFLFVPGLATVASTPLWSEVARLLTRDSFAELRLLWGRWMIAAAAASAIAAGLGSLLLPSAMALMVPDVEAPAAVVRAALFASAVALSVSAPVAAYLGSLRLHWRQAGSALLMCGANLGLSIVLVQTWLGAAGPPASTALCQTLLTVVPMSILVGRRLQPQAVPA